MKKYIAIATKGLSINVFPSLMRWKDDIYIAVLSELDLYLEKTYKNLIYEDALKEYLKENIGEDIAICYGDNISRVIITLYSMLDRDMTTTVCTDSELSMRFLTDASWDIWWKFNDEYEAYKELLTKKPDKKYKSQKAKLQSISLTMGWIKPSALFKLDDFSIRKRYGQSISDVFLLVKNNDDSIFFSLDK